MYIPPKRILIDAELFIDLFVLVEMASRGRFDDLLEIELEASELLPRMKEKLDAMQARKEYAERKEKGSR